VAEDSPKKERHMKVLFAYDGSESAAAAIATAAAIVEPANAEAVVLSVWEPLTVQALRATRFGGGPAVPLDVAEVDERSEQQAGQLAEHGAELARQHGYDARAISVADEENIADAILANADKLGVDLIVLGARGLTGVRAFLGSVSNHVLQHAHRPVLVIPSPAEAHGEAKPGQSEAVPTAS
jgi:nucleotide-binding universal stress UspA family protein